MSKSLLFGVGGFVCGFAAFAAVPLEYAPEWHSREEVSRWIVENPTGWGAEDVIVGRTDRESPVYAVGEKIVFTFDLRGFRGLDRSKCSFDWVRTGDDGRRESGMANAAEPLVLSTSLDRPGFVRYYVELLGPDGKPVRRDVIDDEDNPYVRFDGGAGAGVLDIRQAVPAPADFDEFWAAQKRLLAATPWKDGTRLGQIASPREGVELFEVSVPAPGPFPTTGYLAVPSAAKDGRKFPIDVSFWGYGGSWSKWARNPPVAGRLEPDRIRYFHVPHGYELGREDSYYAFFRRKVSVNGADYAFDPVTNSDRDTAYFRFMVLRLLRALEFLKSRGEWDGERLFVHGGSMGGLQSVWCAALDPAVTSASVEVPWCCDIGGTEIGRNRGFWYVKWTPALGYFDPVNMAPRIPATCTVDLPRAGLGDYVCPPTGVMAFYNNLKCPKSARFFQNSRHGYVAPEPFQKFVLKGGSAERAVLTAFTDL